MNMTLLARWRRAVKLGAMLFPALCLVALAGCGEGGGDGSEDTGSMLLVSVAAADDFGRNVDTAPDDTDGDGLLDNLLTDTTVSISFVNRSVVPEEDTATVLRVDSYTVAYTTPDPSAPPLSARTFDAAFTVDPDQTVERGDILLVALATVDEYNAGVALGFIPTDDPTEYTAHYTFHVENVPFGESQTVTANVAFSVGDFLPAD
jgi:hypothetical protein